MFRLALNSLVALDACEFAAVLWPQTSSAGIVGLHSLRQQCLVSFLLSSDHNKLNTVVKKVKKHFNKAKVMVNTEI